MKRNGSRKIGRKGGTEIKRERGRREGKRAQKEGRKDRNEGVKDGGRGWTPTFLSRGCTPPPVATADATGIKNDTCRDKPTPQPSLEPTCRPGYATFLVVHLYCICNYVRREEG